MRACFSAAALLISISACTQASDRLLEPDLLVEPAEALAPDQGQAMAAWRWTGGGQIVEGPWNISFGGHLTAYPGPDVPEIPGEASLVVQFHNVSLPAISGGTFIVSRMESVNFVLPGDPTLCVAGAFFSLSGTFEGEPGWTLVLRSSDGGAGRWARSPDTVRFTLRDPSDVLVYGSAAGDPGGEFPKESTCVGGGRTNLDHGNLTIFPPGS